jgi:hypothetical protein
MLGFCLVVMFALSLAASAQKFTIRTINIDPPGAIGVGWGSTRINAASVVTGEYYDASGIHGFIRSPDGRYTSFDVAGARWVAPTGINSVGEIVGTTSYTGGGFLREPDGTITMLFGPGSIDLSPAAINDAGTIAGFFWAPGSDTGFVRSRDGAVTTFGVPGATQTVPTGINAAGATTGYYFDANGIGHGFLRARNGRFTTFNAPGAWTTHPQGDYCPYTSPKGINSAGEITGYYGDMDRCALHGFLRHRDGTFTIIDAPGSDVTEAVAVNAAGTVVGFYLDPYQRGFVRLHGVVTKFYPPGSSNTNPTSINDRGWITGDYDNHIFLAIPMDESADSGVASPQTTKTDE